MIVYEVTLEIEKKISQDFRSWLTEHVQAMLQHQGFVSGEIFEIETFDHLKMQFAVIYRVKSRMDLQQYLDHHSIKMRSQGIEKFGNQFTAARRILIPVLSP